jgi:hypothetical protein
MATFHSTPLARPERLRLLEPTRIVAAVPAEDQNR